MDLTVDRHLFSTGIPSLDSVIGGGIPPGGVFLIEEDLYGRYSDVILKYFLSESIVKRQSFSILTLNDEPRKFAYDLPALTLVDEKIPDKKPSIEEELKIAWRYSQECEYGMKKHEDLQAKKHFDYPKIVVDDMICDSKITYWPNSYPYTPDNDLVDRAYQELYSFLDSQMVNYNSLGSTVALRVGIQSFGSPHWLPIGYQHNKNVFKRMIEFLYKLRSIVKNKNVAVMITIPTHLYQHCKMTNHLYHSVDGCIKLKSFDGSKTENNSLWKDYHGLLDIPKLFSLNSTHPHVTPTEDLAFRLHRKKIIIEKLHLPPELRESTKREQDEGAVGCSGIKNKNLDF